MTARGRRFLRPWGGLARWEARNDDATTLVGRSKPFTQHITWKDSRSHRGFRIPPFRLFFRSNLVKCTNHTTGVGTFSSPIWVSSSKVDRRIDRDQAKGSEREDYDPST